MDRRDVSILDRMRLPLGILTGVGRLGAGAIPECGERVEALATAAALWAVTLIRIGRGAGEDALALMASALGFGSRDGVEARVSHVTGRLQAAGLGRLAWPRRAVSGRRPSDGGRVRVPVR